MGTIPSASPSDEAEEVELVDWGNDDNVDKDEVPLANLVTGLNMPPSEAPSAPTPCSP